MLIQNKVRILFAVAVIAVNGWFVSDSGQVGATQVQTAGIGILPKFKMGHKTYDSLGKWIGCEVGPPKQCVMMSIPLTRVFVSTEGVILE